MPPGDTHTCLEDGIPVAGTITFAGPAFVFHVVGCQLVFLHLTPVGEGAGILLHCIFLLCRCGNVRLN